MTSTHTPGPWLRFRDGTQRSGYLLTELGLQDTEARIIEGKNGHVVAMVFDEYGPDSSLIAAAPDLLEACKAQHDAIDLLFAMLMERDSTFSPRKSGGQPWKAIQLGNAAIAKAEGRTP